ncbi:DNA polymerase III subunit gamma/tau [Pseudoalteromonas sp. KG3]|uniref:DNA polymerase III subunit gamma/tau n=1 Tax=Pseudoalteromonas prydzensis TaxID=182141 RepID=A0ABR9FLM7_9GAMM|nr:MULTISPECIES: DNA polymerase III subunit gamma/tau [Pseudoalteromonas]MBE0457717.1 DNA polymerase III subunit gamma/tau [Pseudoalteromonas prydzensis]WKD23533.1 DNA polymerase III subunit gamma/tau [Pseudoalteromonas sp. KG3]
MSYQVLARKWRPQTFHELVGQSHVKQALINALTQNRLHHAYLFTGTRGVGKTTIARIFAKSLNCDEGISAQPCGKCSSCVDIETGRYIDLLEIDAASRTKVEDTREILDNVQYAPTRGRYKVYLIDEVHMLSKHSFNALLKTLEEPPEHVKFLLATTDPQKLPVTILSRCLQFNLNALSQPEILQQLEYVLGEEKLRFETQALQIIAKAADGSMRDALSLTDQAIAQTNGDIQHQAVQAMLGLIDNHYSQHLLVALLAQDGPALMAQIEQVATQNPNYIALLDDLIGLTHLTQLTQLVPDAAKLDDYNREFISEVALSCDSQQIQVYYQLLLNGKKDLQWAPEPRLGFEMIMLRLLAFQPIDNQVLASTTTTAKSAEQKRDRAGSLRDILNKNKQVSLAHIDNQATLSTTSATEEDKTVDNTVSPEAVQQAQFSTVNNEPTQAAAAASQTSDSNATADDSDSELEQQLASQYDDVMSNAAEQGFHADNAHYAEHYGNEQQPDVEQSSAALQSASLPEYSPTTDVGQKEAQAQSAIARILRDRNISGAGTLSGGKLSTQSQMNSTAEVESNLSVKKPQPQITGTPSPSQAEVGSYTPKSVPTKVLKPDFKEKHQTIVENLAPELLEQINPQKVVTEAEPEINIQVPDDFQSPISDIRFAHQQDEWAYLIKRMGLGGRMRQFALHSIYSKQQQQLHLEVDESQKHLDTPMLRQKLSAALASIYEHNVDLTINFAAGVIDSPYLIQQKIDAGRHQQAIDVINSDENIVQLQQLFSAIIDENSIQAL